MEVIKLNNGVEMPLVGLGTHGIPNDMLGEAIDIAYQIGYRKLDTAWLYANESVIGNALKHYNIPRHELFITSKLHVDNLYIRGYHTQFPNIRIRSVKSAFEQTCKRLCTDYLDLYLIHWPFLQYEQMWEEIVKLYEAGRIRAIGVSSFLPNHLDVLIKNNDTIPAVNQFEVNPYNAQLPEVEYNQRHGIHVEAYATFGTTRKKESASEDILKNPLICDLASKYSKTTSQLILRWVVQRGISVIPRSKSRQHLLENLDIFDFKLTNEEMTQMLSLDKQQYSRGNPHLS